MLIARSHISVSPSISAFAPFLRSATFPCGIWRIQKIQKLLFSERKDPQSIIQGLKYIQKPRMAGLKRKQVPNATSSIPSVSKKPKNEVSQTKKAPRAMQVLETEADSDPIVESDTTENSGDDDAVSWPSDDAPAAQESSADEEAGVTIPKSAAKASSYVTPKTKKASIGMISPSVIKGI